MNRLCPLCEKLVETHYPGISYIRVNQQLTIPLATNLRPEKPKKKDTIYSGTD